MRQRITPNGYDKKIRIEELNIDVYYSLEKLCSIMYSGKSNKPVFHIRFKTSESMLQYIDRQITERQNRAAEKAANVAAKKALNADLKAIDHFKPGDIVVNSWGWEQTNIDFYEVTEVLNKKIRVKELCKSYDETGFLSGNSVPLPGVFRKDGKDYLLSLKFDLQGICWICNPENYYYFHKWEGKPMYESHYA